MIEHSCLICGDHIASTAPHVALDALYVYPDDRDVACEYYLHEKCARTSIGGPYDASIDEVDTDDERGVLEDGVGNRLGVDRNGDLILVARGDTMSDGPRIAPTQHSDRLMVAVAPLTLPTADGRVDIPATAVELPTPPADTPVKAYVWALPDGTVAAGMTPPDEMAAILAAVWLPAGEEGGADLVPDDIQERWRADDEA